MKTKYFAIEYCYRLKCLYCATSRYYYHVLSMIYCGNVLKKTMPVGCLRNRRYCINTVINHIFVFQVNTFYQ